MRSAILTSLLLLASNACRSDSASTPSSDAGGGSPADADAVDLHLGLEPSLVFIVMTPQQRAQLTVALERLALARLDLALHNACSIQGLTNALVADTPVEQCEMVRDQCIAYRSEGEVAFEHDPEMATECTGTVGDLEACIAGGWAVESQLAKEADCARAAEITPETLPHGRNWPDSCDLFYRPPCGGLLPEARYNGSPVD